MLIGVLVGLLGAFFLLFAVVAALSLVLSVWVAALIVALGMAVVCAIIREAITWDVEFCYGFWACRSRLFCFCTCAPTIRRSLPGCDSRARRRRSQARSVSRFLNSR